MKIELPIPYKISLILTITLVILIMTSCKQKVVGTVTASETPEIDTPDFLKNKQQKAKVLLMGVFHFSDAGLDGYKPKHNFDVMSDNGQREIKEIIQALKKYNYWQEPVTMVPRHFI